jgi:tetratricopeptide (TPR) repeat protein
MLGGGMTETPPFAGHVVVFVGTLARLGRREAAAIVERQRGRAATSVTRATTMVIVGEDAARLVERESLPGTTADERRVNEARRLDARHPGRVRFVTAAEFYALAGVEGSGASEPVLHASRSIRSLYPTLRDDQLRYLERLGLVQPVRGRRQERFYRFADLAVLRQASTELEQGSSFRAVVQRLVAARQGQLTFDFQLPAGDVLPAKVIALPPRHVRAHVTAGIARDDRALELATEYFTEGAELDAGDEEQQEAAMIAYRRALALDPTLTAALVNLANVHYGRDEIVEAEALYEKALAIERGCFEAHFNLGNVYHDTSRFEQAARCYTQALALDASYADAHFYLAVTLEKLGRSSEARPHWVAYQRLAPRGEWVELAKEFSE